MMSDHESVVEGREVHCILQFRVECLDELIKRIDVVVGVIRVYGEPESSCQVKTVIAV